jgi:hypothetical protein
MNTTTQQPARISCVKLPGYKIELTENRHGKPVARLFKLLTAGRNKGEFKVMEGYYFPTEQRREEWIKEKVARINSDIKAKSDKKGLKATIRANMQHGFEVGQIYYDSWGYDQTNIDFYQVIEVKEKSVIIREIGAEFVPGTQGMDCSNVKPRPGSWAGEPRLKHIQFYLQNDGNPHYYIKSRHGSISLYDNREKGVYSSWYH